MANSKEESDIYSRKVEFTTFNKPHEIFDEIRNNLLHQNELEIPQRVKEVINFYVEREINIIISRLPEPPANINWCKMAANMRRIGSHVGINIEDEIKSRLIDIKITIGENSENVILLLNTRADFYFNTKNYVKYNNSESQDSETIYDKISKWIRGSAKLDKNTIVKVSAGTMTNKSYRLISKQLNFSGGDIDPVGVKFAMQGKKQQLLEIFDKELLDKNPPTSGYKFLALGEHTWSGAIDITRMIDSLEKSQEKLTIGKLELPSVVVMDGISSKEKARQQLNVR